MTKYKNNFSEDGILIEFSFIKNTFFQFDPKIYKWPFN